MKHTLIILFFLLYNMSTIGLAQESVVIDGAIKISTSSQQEPGNIRWTGSDFEGWNGVEWVSFTKLDYILDIENNSYPVFTIGTQTWMAENLRVTRYNDGTLIDLVTDNTTWSGLSTPGYTWYENTSSSYGALYNWFTVDPLTNGGHNVCPDGWKVPSYDEYQVMANFLGGVNIAGGKLKQSGLSHWQLPNTSGTNESGFTALPAGYRRHDGEFRVVGRNTYWWTSTEDNSNNIRAWYLFVNYDNDNFDNNRMTKKLGLSIRCLKEQ